MLDGTAQPPTSTDTSKEIVKVHLLKVSASRTSHMVRPIRSNECATSLPCGAHDDIGRMSFCRTRNCSQSSACCTARYRFLTPPPSPKTSRRSSRSHVATSSKTSVCVPNDRCLRITLIVELGLQGEGSYLPRRLDLAQRNFLPWNYASTCRRRQDTSYYTRLSQVRTYVLLLAWIYV